MSGRTIAFAATLLLASTAHAELYYLIVAGIGGEPKYEEQFKAQAEALFAAARRTTGDAARVERLVGVEATRDALRERFGALAAKTTAADTVAVFLLGHGSYDGERYKMNLSGPDIDGEELAQLFSAIPARNQLIVNATSASGAVLESWAAEGRTVITATRSGAERNATRFAEHWAAALSSGDADINKNGQLTAQEAFDFASRRVADSFEATGTLATEHPQLAGDTAARINVARLGERPVVTAATAPLQAEVERLEGEIDALRARREQMTVEAYTAQLQELLVQLALVQRQIDDAAAAE